MPKSEEGEGICREPSELGRVNGDTDGTAGRAGCYEVLQAIVRACCFIISKIGNYERSLAGEQPEPVYIVKHYRDVSVVWTKY